MTIQYATRPAERRLYATQPSEPRLPTDPVGGVIDRTGEFFEDTPDAEGPPTVCVVPGLNHIAFLGKPNPLYGGHLYDLRRYAPGDTAKSDLTDSVGAPDADGTPYFYVDTQRNAVILLYRNSKDVRSLNWSTGVPTSHKLAPDAEGDPVGVYVPSTDTHHVIYRDKDGHLHEVQWVGETPTGALTPKDLTADATPPPDRLHTVAAGDPTTFFDETFNNAVYRDKDNHIRRLYWYAADSGPIRHEPLSRTAGTPEAAAKSQGAREDSDPFGYYTAHNDTKQVVYCANDGHIYELYWAGGDTVQGWDIMPTVGNPDATGNLAAYYSAGTNTKHVFYRSDDGQLHEIWWDAQAGGPTQTHRVNLTRKFGAPTAADRPAAFKVEESQTHHVVYRGDETKHIYELIWAEPMAPPARTLFVTSEPQPAQLWPGADPKVFFTSIQAAIDEAGTMDPAPSQLNPVAVIIYPGTYKENIDLQSWVFLSSASTHQNAVTIDGTVTWTLPKSSNTFEVVLS